MDFEALDLPRGVSGTLWLPDELCEHVKWVPNCSGCGTEPGGPMEWLSEEVTVCPGCDGWGWNPEMLNQWEEDEDSPSSCCHCDGLGYVRFEESN